MYVLIMCRVPAEYADGRIWIDMIYVCTIKIRTAQCNSYISYPPGAAYIIDNFETDVRPLVEGKNWRYQSYFN